MNIATGPFYRFMPLPDFHTFGAGEIDIDVAQLPTTEGRAGTMA